MSFRNSSKKVRKGEGNLRSKLQHAFYWFLFPVVLASETIAPLAE